jgi:N6-adenosine-specific RNA methylase IME4
MAVFRRIEDVPLFRYGLIMADPPWAFQNWSATGETKNATAHYRCSSLHWIRGLRVADLAARDCVLWLWATNPLLPQALDVLAAWGFTYKTAGHWSKKTVTGKQAFGTGYIFRNAGEPYLIGTIGRPRTARDVRSVIEGIVREHSRKPEEAYRAAERLCGDVPRLEIFGRASRGGWDVMGDEATKFDSIETEDSHVRQGT